MKIRKSILAAATAATVSVSGIVAAPAFAAENETTTSTAASESTGKNENNNDDNEGQKKQPKSNSSDAAEKMFYDYNKDSGEYYLSPAKITAWFGVISTALSLFAKVFQFGQDNFNLPF